MRPGRALPRCPATGQTHATRRGSLTAADVEALGFSNSPSVSESGRFVVVPVECRQPRLRDSNAEPDIFVKDLVLGTVTRMTNGPGGAAADGASRTGNAPAISDDGRYVVFESEATDLVSDSLLTSPNIFRHDRVTGADGAREPVELRQTPCSTASTRPSISGNGRFVSFESGGDVFRPGHGLGTTTDVSVNSAESFIGGTDSALSDRRHAHRVRESNLRRSSSGTSRREPRRRP